MISKKDQPKGFIAIVSLLIITSVAMIFSMSILKDGVENASLSLSSIYYESARINSIICLEDVFYRIRQEEKFIRNLNYSISNENSCTTNIEWFAPQQVGTGIVETLVNLDISGISNSFERNYTYQLKITRYDVNHSDGSLEYMNNIGIVSIEETIT